jgi:hypothetical protein
MVPRGSKGDQPGRYDSPLEISWVNCRRSAASVDSANMNVIGRDDGDVAQVVRPRHTRRQNIERKTGRPIGP